MPPTVLALCMYSLIHSWYSHFMKLRTLKLERVRHLVKGHSQQVRKPGNHPRSVWFWSPLITSALCPPLVLRGKIYLQLGISWELLEILLAVSEGEVLPQQHSANNLESVLISKCYSKFRSFFPYIWFKKSWLAKITLNTSNEEAVKAQNRKRPLKTS